MERRSRETVGQLIDGRYKLLRLMGEGGMGRVYEAEHVGIGKHVAIKVLHAMFSNIEDVVTRFRQEARIASQIGNAHIVDVTDSGTTDDGRFYFAMEYLDGVELGSAIHADGPLEIRRALHITRQIAEGLSAAHGRGVIHRDLKPENILLVERDGNPDFVKVLDFGIARMVDGDKPQRRLTQPGLAMGTPEYMAPEQALALTTDARSDVYSLGAILYEMLTATQPYRAETFTQVLVLKSSTEPTPPKDLRADLPDEIQALVMKAMARKPEDRYQSMTELAYDVSKCLEGRDAAVSRIIGVTPLPAVAHAMAGPPRAADTPAPFADVPVDEAPVDEPADEMRVEEIDEPIAADAADAPPVFVDAPAAGQLTSEPARRRVTARAWIMLGLLALIGAGAAWYFLVWLPGQEAKRANATAPAPARNETAARSVGADQVAARPTDVAPATDERPADATRTDAGPPASVAGKPAPTAKTPPPGPPPKTLKQARALMAKAVAAIGAKKWDVARQLLGRVARSKHLRPEATLALARVELAAGNAAGAVEQAEASVKLGGGVPAQLVLARSLAKAGRRPDAIKQYRLILKKQPKNKDAKRELAELARAPAKRKRR